MRIAVFGIRSLPPSAGSGGADTFAQELYPRIVQMGHEVTVYCRMYYEHAGPAFKEFLGVRLFHLSTISRSGFDTLVHSCKSAIDIIVHNTGDVVHIHNGGNSIWAIALKLFGKKVFISQDGVDWKRKKWKWYARVFLKCSSYITAHVPDAVIFDNIFAKELFEKKFKKRFLFIPYGADFKEPIQQDALDKYQLREGEYFLFIGRFIPDKGIHYLIRAFEHVATDKSLVLIGGSPNPNSEYEQELRSTNDPRIRFLGFVYNDEMLQILKGAYCYIQPSDVEGLSPVLLTAMGLSKPIICSDIPENLFAVDETALIFKKSNIESLRDQISRAIQTPDRLQELAASARHRALTEFSWNRVAAQHIEVFSSVH